MKAGSMMHELILKVLGREEPFNLSIRRGNGTLRFARDSTMYLVPPIEVRENQVTLTSKLIIGTSFCR